METLLETKGETSEEDKKELLSMSRDELVAFIINLNRSWYQLLERLEGMHRQDILNLERDLKENEQKASEELKKELQWLETKFLDGKEEEKKTMKSLDSLRKLIEHSNASEQARKYLRENLMKS